MATAGFLAGFLLGLLALAEAEAAALLWVTCRLHRRQEGAAAATTPPGDQELPGEQPFPYEKKVRRTRPSVKRCSRAGRGIHVCSCSTASRSSDACFCSPRTPWTQTSSSTQAATAETARSGGTTTAAPSSSSSSPPTTKIFWMFAVGCFYVHMLDVVASRCHSPFHSYLREVMDDGVVIIDTEYLGQSMRTISPAGPFKVPQ